MDNSHFLIHYASKYYDPVKAHEYYEEHKKLKGRTSTAGLNEEGRKAAQYVKKRINDERDSKIASSKNRKVAKIQGATDLYKAQNNVYTNQRDTNIKGIKADRDATYKQLKDDYDSDTKKMSEEKKKKVESARNTMNSHIEALRLKLKSMSKEEKAARSDEIQSEIAKLRDENKQHNADLNENYKSDRAVRTQQYKSDKTAEKTESDLDINTERTSYKEAKAKISEIAKNTKQSASSTYIEEAAAHREEAVNKYAAELEKIRADSSMVATKKSKR